MPAAPVETAPQAPPAPKPPTAAEVRAQGIVAKVAEARHGQIVQERDERREKQQQQMQEARASHSPLQAFIDLTREGAILQGESRLDTPAWQDARREADTWRNGRTVLIDHGSTMILRTEPGVVQRTDRDIPPGGLRSFGDALRHFNNLDPRVHLQASRESWQARSDRRAARREYGQFTSAYDTYITAEQDRLVQAEADERGQVSDTRKEELRATAEVNVRAAAILLEAQKQAVDKAMKKDPVVKEAVDAKIEAIERDERRKVDDPLERAYYEVTILAELTATAQGMRKAEDEHTQELKFKASDHTDFDANLAQAFADLYPNIRVSEATPLQRERARYQAVEVTVATMRKAEEDAQAEKNAIIGSDEYKAAYDKRYLIALKGGTFVSTSQEREMGDAAVRDVQTDRARENARQARENEEGAKKRAESARVLQQVAQARAKAIRSRENVQNGEDKQAVADENRADALVKRYQEQASRLRAVANLADASDGDRAAATEAEALRDAVNDINGRVAGAGGESGRAALVDQAGRDRKLADAQVQQASERVANADLRLKLFEDTGTEAAPIEHAPTLTTEEVQAVNNALVSTEAGGPAAALNRVAEGYNRNMPGYAEKKSFLDAIIAGIRKAAQEKGVATAT